MAITLHTSDAQQQASDGITRTWAAMPNGNQGDAGGGNYLEASFTATGTFGAGGSVRLEGSQDNVNWFALSPAALTAAGIFAPLGAAEHPKYIRPSVTAGDGTTAITVVGFFALPRRAF